MIHNELYFFVLSSDFYLVNCYDNLVCIQTCENAFERDLVKAMAEDFKKLLREIGAKRHQAYLEEKQQQEAQNAEKRKTESQSSALDQNALSKAASRVAREERERREQARKRRREETVRADARARAAQRARLEEVASSSAEVSQAVGSVRQRVQERLGRPRFPSAVFADYWSEYLRTPDEASLPAREQKKLYMAAWKALPKSRPRAEERIPADSALRERFGRRLASGQALHPAGTYEALSQRLFQDLRDAERREQEDRMTAQVTRENRENRETRAAVGGVQGVRNVSSGVDLLNAFRKSS